MGKVLSSSSSSSSSSGSGSGGSSSSSSGGGGGGGGGSSSSSSSSMRSGSEASRKVRLAAPVALGAAEHAARGGEVVVDRLLLGLLGAEQRHAEERAQLPVVQLVRARVLEQQLHLLPQPRQVDVAQRAQRALLDQLEILELELLLRVGLHARAQLLEQVARLAQLRVQLHRLRERRARRLQLP